MNIFFRRHDVTKSEEKEDFLVQAKEIKRNFLIELAKAYQHYLPLNNDFLRYLQYVCPKKATEEPDAEKYLLKIAKKLPHFDVYSETDNLKKEIRMMRSQKEHFGEGLVTYLTNYVEGFKLQEDKEKNICIGKVWEPIISSPNYPTLSKVIRSVLSIFHGTASVEGAIKVTRNILSERSHRLTDENLNARKIVKSAVKARTEMTCCFDHDISGKKYHDD